MKKRILLFILIFFTSTSIFAEHIFNALLPSIGFGYEKKAFQYNDVKFDSNDFYIPLGYTYQFYPSYNSFFGFLVGINAGVKFSGLAQNENNDFKSIETSTSEGIYSLDSFPIFFSTDLAFNFRLPAVSEKFFPYIRLGASWEISLFELTKTTKISDGYYTYTDTETLANGNQQKLSAFFDLGFQPKSANYDDMYWSNVTIRFFYDFLTKNPLTENNWINANNFGFYVSYSLMQMGIDTGKDKKQKEQVAIKKIEDDWAREEERKQEILKMMDSEDKYSDFYKVVEEKECTVSDLEYFSDKLRSNEGQFDEAILEIPITAKFYRRQNESKTDWMDYSEKFLRDISFFKHSLGNGKPGSVEYISYKTDYVTLPFYTDEEKERAFEALVEEINVRKEQKKRIAENKKLNPNNYDYMNLPVLYMARMDEFYEKNPTLVSGKVYLADELYYFHIVNRMGSNEYNMAANRGYGSYQFIIEDVSGKEMKNLGDYGYYFMSTAYLRYVGTELVFMADGSKRYLPYFEILEKDPSNNKVRTILRECQNW